MPPEAILNLDMYRGTRLKQGVSSDLVTETFNAYNRKLADSMTRCKGVLWHQAGDNVIYTFPNPASAIEAALSFGNELSIFNQEKNKIGYEHYCQNRCSFGKNFAHSKTQTRTSTR